MRQLIAFIAVLLTFVGYIPYILDTLRGKTKPHSYTWFIWFVVTSVAFALQISQHAGPGAFVTLAAAIIVFLIFILSLFHGGGRNITRADNICLLLCFLAIILWPIANQPVPSIIIVSFVDMMAFVPTIRKSWAKPHQETLISYVINTLRFVLAFIALDHYTLVTVLYPLTWVVANGVFSGFLILRRSKLV